MLLIFVNGGSLNCVFFMFLSVLKFRSHLLSRKATLVFETTITFYYVLFGQKRIYLVRRVLSLTFFQDPPESPTLTTFTRDTLIAGKTLSLQCESLGGNPLASIVWKVVSVIN